MMKKVLTILKVLFLAMVLLFIPRVGTWVANMFNYDAIDPDGAFMWISIHHIIQALIFLIIIVIIRKFKPMNFHLGLGNKEVGFKYLKRFMIIFALYTIIAFTVILLLDGFGAFQYPLNARNIIGYLGFQLLLSGPSEELIFRAFAITIFVTFISSKRVDKHLSFAVLFAAVIFGIAHIQFSFQPFGLSYSLQQVFYAIGLGYFYGDCYEKSKSVIYPMIMHSYVNVLIVVFTIILSFIF